MQNLIQVVVKLAEVFDRLQLHYAIGGALASNYWGILRATEDVDCLISLPGIKYQLFADELNANQCKMQDQRGQLIEITVPAMLAQVRARKLIECFFPLNAAMVRVELFVPAVALQDEILRRALPIAMGGKEILITTAEDLILLKLIFHRIKDVQDVRGILWIQGKKLDLDYLRHWSARTHEPNVQQQLEQLIVEYASRDK